MKINFYVGFNNYYNRKVIVHDSLADYEDKLLLTIPNVNFKPKDGINTEQIVNTTQVIDYQVFNLSNTPDYAVVADDDNTIISRWFVTQYESLIYKNQYRAVLRRDVIADNFDAVIEAPVFIEKATITDKTDPAIFNSENMGFNQIKTSETLLKDLTKCPWIVGYIPTNNSVSFEGLDTPMFDHYSTSGGILSVNTYQYAQQTAWSYPFPIGSNPYIMFCMPYTDCICRFGNEEGQFFQNDKDICLHLATQIGTMITDESSTAVKLFDVQLLPYCPLRLDDGTLMVSFSDILDENNNPIGRSLDLTNVQYSAIRKVIDKDAQTSESRFASLEYSKGVVFWCRTNKFTFDIDYSLPLPDTALEMKVKNETEMYRLCSPNYNGQFEFNPMKNGGVTKFNVDCMYQPYNPYIHMNPDFGGLYGEDYNDARGLICQGDFSLPQETSAWANYVQNNKNYQNIFDRQIQNMERMNDYQMTSQVVSAGVGVLQGMGTGAFIGSGMAMGGKAGAAIGGIASIAGGIADTIMLANQQKETLDYTKDQFGYQMGNIKAMPNSISKTNPFTNNNKIFPVLEKYGCTSKEVDALEKKMEYNGMTIMRIGKIKDWLHEEESYIKGKFIMFDSSIEEDYSHIEEDYHTVVEIAQELDKGIRAKKEA